jgi:hypothetical protein
LDEFTRKALTIECHRRIDADKTGAVLDRLIGERGSAPVFLRCDNGPEMTGHALRDWCRFSRAGSAYIEPGLAVGFALGDQERRLCPTRGMAVIRRIIFTRAGYRGGRDLVMDPETAHEGDPRYPDHSRRWL